MKKFAKEFGMCKVLADAGYKVELLEERPGISSCDILLNGIPCDLKKIGGTSKNIEKYGRKAAHHQGAKMVAFEFDEIGENVLQSIKKLSLEGIHGIFYKSGYTEVHIF